MSSEAEARLHCRKCGGDKGFTLGTFVEHIAYEHVYKEGGETSHFSLKCLDCQGFFYGTMAAGDHTRRTAHTVVPNVSQITSRSTASYEWYELMRQYGSIIGMEKPQEAVADPQGHESRRRSPSPSKPHCRDSYHPHSVVRNATHSPSPQRYTFRQQEYQRQQNQNYDEWEHNIEPRSVGRSNWEPTPRNGRLDSGYTEDSTPQRHDSRYDDSREGCGQYDKGQGDGRRQGNVYEQGNDRRIEERDRRGDREHRDTWHEDRHEEHVYDVSRGRGDRGRQDKIYGQIGHREEGRERMHGERDQRDHRHDDRRDERGHEGHRDGGRLENVRGQGRNSRYGEREENGGMPQQTPRRTRTEEEIQHDRRMHDLQNKIANITREKAHNGDALAGDPTLPYSSSSRDRLGTPKTRQENSSGLDYSKLGGDRGRPPPKPVVVTSPPKKQKEGKKKKKQDKILFCLPPPGQQMENKSPWVPSRWDDVDPEDDRSPSSVQVLEPDKTPIRAITDEHSVYVEEDLNVTVKSSVVVPPSVQQLLNPESHLVTYSDSEDDSSGIVAIDDQDPSNDDSSASQTQKRSSGRHQETAPNSRSLAKFCYEEPRNVQKDASFGSLSGSQSHGTHRSDNDASEITIVEERRSGGTQNNILVTRQGSRVTERSAVAKEVIQVDDSPEYHLRLGGDVLSRLDFSNLAPSSSGKTSIASAIRQTEINHAELYRVNNQEIDTPPRFTTKTPESRETGMGIPRIFRSAKREPLDIDNRSARERAASGWETRNLHGDGSVSGKSFSRYAGQRASNDVQTIRVMDVAPPRQPTPPPGSKEAILKQKEAKLQREKERKTENRRKSLGKARKRHHSEHTRADTGEEDVAPGEIHARSYSERENSDKEAGGPDIRLVSPSVIEKQGGRKRIRSLGGGEVVQRSTPRAERHSSPHHHKPSFRHRSRSPPGREIRSYSRSSHCGESLHSRSPSPRH